MKKLIMLIVLALALIAYIVYKSTSSNQNSAFSGWDPRERLFIEGSEEEIRKHFETPKSMIHYGDLWSLIRRNRNDLLEMLLKDYKVDPDMAAKYNADTALLYASEMLKPESVKILLKYGADVNYQNRYGKTALNLTSNSIENIPPYGSAKVFEVTKLLVEKGVNINFETDSGLSAVGRAIFDNDLLRLKYLNDNGGIVNQVDSDKIHYIFYCRSLECVEFLESEGSNISILTPDGRNLLQSIVNSSGSKLELIKGIINLGIDICHKDNEGKTVLNHAEEMSMNPHLINDNPEGYKERIAENKTSETYKYLEKEYNKKCLTLESN